MSRAERTNTALGLSVAGLCLLAGCAAPPNHASSRSSPDPATIGDPDWVWTETEASDAPSSGLEAMIARQASDLERFAASGGAEQPEDQTAMLDRAPPLRIEPTLYEPTRTNSRGSVALGRTDEPTTPQPMDGLLRALSLAGGGPGVLAEAPPAATPEPKPTKAAGNDDAAAPAPDRGARIAELAGELASLLKEESAESDDPARPLVAAALLESVAAGSLPEADLPGGGRLMLTERERVALASLRELAVRLIGDGSDASGDPHRVRQTLLEAAESLREHAQIRIERAELCTRAPGFGSYLPIERRTFLAGRTNRVVVYAELEHFGLRPATEAEAAVEGDRVAADLKQEMELYLSQGDDQPTWQREVDWLPRTSRRGFRDMFVATPIELPPTLSVGEYDLRIRIIDEVSGAQDETTLAIRIVADSSVLNSGPSRLRANNDRDGDRGRNPDPAPPQQGGFSPGFASGSIR
ncbi:MAG: hypothetical protein AAFR96_01170 [Planctomycetota bacterium]